MSATTATGTLPFATPVAPYPADTTTVSSERPSWPGLPPTLGLKEFFGSLSRADDLYYTSEPEPIPNNRFWTTEQRALRKRRDGVETTTPTREQLGEAILVSHTLTELDSAQGMDSEDVRGLPADRHREETSLYSPRRVRTPMHAPRPLCPTVSRPRTLACSADMILLD